MSSDTQPVELWSAAQVAAFLGLADSHSARRQLSRWKIAAERHVLGESGRPEARYDAGRVRAAAQSRPGRGARTDLAIKEGATS